MNERLGRAFLYSRFQITTEWKWLSHYKSHYKHPCWNVAVSMGIRSLPHLAAATIPKSKVTRLAWSEGKLGGSSHVITYCWHGWFLVWSPFGVDLVAVGIFPPGEKKNIFLIGILVRKKLWRWTWHWFWIMTALKSREYILCWGLAKTL